MIIYNNIIMMMMHLGIIRLIIATEIKGLLAGN